jgi:hypothetical protein
VTTIARNFKKNPHTATWLKTFHTGSGQNLPAEITEDGRKLDSDGNTWVSDEDRAAMDFLNSDVPADEYQVPERAPAAPQRVITGARRPAGYEVEFAGHKVRCGDSFVSEAQANWLVDILVKREVADAESILVRLEQGLAKMAGSALITAHKNAPFKQVRVTAAMAEAIAPGASTAEIEAVELPAGRYAVCDPTDSVIKFFKFDRPTTGRWAGYSFLKVQASDDLYPVRDQAKKALILAEIAKDVKGAEQAYGQLLGRCYACGRTLTDATSRELGIGPECRKK